MKHNVIGEISLSLILIGLLLFFLSPFNFLMPHQMHPLMVPLLIILFVAFLGFFWKEMPGDEREQLHKFIASRIAYITVVTTLLVGICVQSIKGTVDAWLIIAVCLALLAKLAGLMYGYFKR